MASPCTNDPNEVISAVVGIQTAEENFEQELDEAVDTATENADKFDDFVNGTDTQTVQLGEGAPTPTIRNTVRQMMSAASELPNADVSGKSSTANGGSTMRTLAERFGDIVNAKNFGAKGDGATDDTAAFTAALAAGERVFVPAGTYAVSKDVPLERCYGYGSLKFSSGREISLDGVMEADSVSQLFLQEINPSTNEGFQDICIIDDYIFACRPVDDGVKIAKYELNFNVNTTYSIGARAGTQASVEYELGLSSHGEGVHGYKDENGDIWLYVPYNPVSGSYGFYKIKWSDTSTPTYAAYTVDVLPNQAQCAVSHDGRYLVFVRSTNIDTFASYGIYSNQFFVYNREEIENSSSALPIANFNVPRTGSFNVRSGLDCDGRYIYLITSSETFGKPQNIAAFTFSGEIAKSWKVDAWTACFPDDVRNGDGTRYLTEHEAEGICIYKDMLVFYAKAYFTTPSSGGYCTYDGVTFVARKSSTGKNPCLEPAYWTPTSATITGVAAWDATATYASPSAIVHHKFICALAPKGRYAKEYPVNIRFYNTDVSAIHGEAGLVVSEGENSGIIFARKSSQTNRVLPRLTVRDDAFVLSQTTKYTSAPSNGREAVIEKSGDDSFLAIRSHGGPVAQGAVFYMYPCETMQSTDSYYGGIRCWTGGSETFRALKESFTLLKNLLPSSNNSISLGSSSVKWKNVYCATGAFNGSDRRLKQNIDEVDETVMRAWSRVSFKVFKFIDAVQEKGEEAARLHVGVIAQEIVEAFASEGLDAFRYGLVGWNSFEDQYEDVDVEDEPAVYDENGLMLSEAKTHFEKTLVSAAHDEYIVRYSEILALECAYQRWLGEKRDARIAELEARLNKNSGNSPAPSGASSNNL